MDQKRSVKIVSDDMLSLCLKEVPSAAGPSTTIPNACGRLLLQPTLERQNGRCVVDCRGKGRVATDIATYKCSIYRVKNEHDIVIKPRLQHGLQ